MEKTASYTSLIESFSWDDVFKHYDWNPKEYFNVAHEVCDRYAGDPQRIALFYENHSGEKRIITYEELRNWSNQMANVFRKIGIKKGDRVCALLPKNPALVVYILAAWKVGAVYVPLFTAFGPQAVEYRINNCEAKAILTNREQRAKLPTKDKAPTLEHIFVIDGPTEPHDWDFWETLSKESSDHVTEKMTVNDLLAIQYTSGSTGMPKGAMWTHNLLINIYPYMRYAVDLRDDDIFLGGADPGWAYGLIFCTFAPMCFGVPIVLYEGPFKAETYYELMEKYGVTNFAFAPTAYRAMVAAGEELITKYDIRVRAMSSAGEPLNPEVIRFFQKNLGVTVHDHYGLSETLMLIGNFNSLDMDILPGSMGWALPGFEVALLDDQGQEVPTGEVGQIAFHTHSIPNVFHGYWKDPEKTAQRMIGDWFLTGDLALKDENGYFWFQGRADDIISSAGYRIGPFEVESSLIEHPAVVEAAVVGKPDPLKGEIVKAFVVLANAYEPTKELAEELSLFVKNRLSKHEYPREVEFVAELPKTSSGKIQRFILRNQEIEKQKNA
ncbi:AMP-binding enzyme family protein [Anoxybacillus sp. B7M1]|jgi:acetyl-CoA synthetase|uniref:acyl-CoA synthetase n=1 Tax=Anoxybacillaceae TaxID=3120669 RepID=UPI0005CD7735|nr:MULTISPECIES: AMP-binding protein [Anoxybacillus]ANB56645.1 AMP-binding enzyme family protein [Anoxybacillus sp. B2M1]ANB64235.1 AMP-binding enzyme family protein [Anoxybacillus sp. B7M1]MBB3907055.1 acetyl-CoA synthetase [Anoxybacillus rupiensis]MBS2771417.1 AMP-binding protein [Anoxybacillus rupiensis]OQM45589.1 acetate--CoA ligase [Anoxybacillus sp. UARK-01]